MIQRGTTVAVGFGSFAYSGYVPSDATVSFPDGNKEVIRAADGSTMTKIYMDPGIKIDVSLVITSGSVTPPADGEIVSLTRPDGTTTSFISEGSTTKYASGATKLNLSLLRETGLSL